MDSLTNSCFFQNVNSKESTLLKYLNNGLTKIFNEAMDNEGSFKESLSRLTYTYQQRSLDPIVPYFYNDLAVKTLTEMFQKYFNTESDSSFINTLKSYSLKMQPVLEFEKAHLRERIQGQFPWVALRRDEMLRILAALKGMSECAIIDISELPAYLEALSKKSPAARERYQLIVCNEVHYTAIDILISGSIKQCAVLDAYGEPKAELIAREFEERGFTVFTSNSKQSIQRDQRSCSIFSLDHVVHSSKNPEFFEMLAGVSILSGDAKRRAIFDWSDLPKEMIKNSQNQSVIEQYIFNQPIEERQSSVNYFERKSIDRKLESYVSKVEEFVRENSLEQIARIACNYPL